LYTFFEWASTPPAIAVIGISNTMDFPERLMPKVCDDVVCVRERCVDGDVRFKRDVIDRTQVKSRLGDLRITFAAYTAANLKVR
jgi:Cdc6-like AAA superfamily ATPase